jgi:pSer/pThr/pTyr-binding forkhead associated (FHA) protein
VPQETAIVSRTKAWLVARSGPLAGSRYLLLSDGSTRIGRSAESDIVVHGPQTATVSAQHLEIVSSGGTWRIRDTGSTNGTYLNGERIAEEAELTGDTVIRLGIDGPEFGFVTEEATTSELDRTLVIPQGIALTEMNPAPSPKPGGHEGLLSDAVRLARRARVEGLGDQTLTLMRDVLHRALHRSSRRSRRVIYALAAALVLISSFGYWKFTRMNGEKASIDRQIQEIEARLKESQQSREQTDHLISQLEAYQGEAQTLQRSLLYRVGGGRKESFVMQEVRKLMAEFGAEVYSIPPEFIERVEAYIEKYQGPDRPHMERAKLRPCAGSLSRNSCLPISLTSR